MTGRDDAIKAVQAFGEASNYFGEEEALTGKLKSDGTVEADPTTGAPSGMIVIRRKGERREDYAYPNGKVNTAISNVPVKVRKTQGGSWEVVGLSAETAAGVYGSGTGTPATPSVPPESSTNILNPRNFNALRPRGSPLGDLFVRITEGVIAQNRFVATADYDLSSYVTATANMRAWIKFGFNTVTGAFVAVTGTDVPASVAQTRDELYALDLGDNTMQIGGISLRNGQASYNPSALVDVRQHISALPPSGVFSPVWDLTGNVLHPVDLANLVSIGADNGTGQLSVVGADGTLVQLRVTGSGAQNIGVPIVRFETSGGTQSLEFTDTGEVVLTNTLQGTNANLNRLSVQNLNTSSIPLEIVTIAAQTANNLRIRTTGNAPLFVVDANGAFVANDQGADADSRIEGDNDANLLFIDAGADRVGIGDAVPDARLHIEGRANELQVYVRGHTSQVANLVLIEANDGTDLLTLDNAGDMVLNGDIDAGNGIFAADVSAASGTFAGAVSITGSADEEQLHIIANPTQTDPILLIETSGGADLLTLSNDGALVIGGTAAPAITVERDGFAQLNLSAASDTTTVLASFRGVRFGGTHASKTAILNNTQILSLLAVGYDGSAEQNGGQIRSIATEDWSGSGRGNAWQFINVPNASTTAAVRMTLQQDGILDVVSLVRAGGFRADGDPGSGVASTVTFTNNVAGTPGTPGTVNAWLKIYNSGNVRYIPTYA